MSNKCPEEYVEEPKILNKNQYNFPINKSSTDVVISVTQSIKKLVEQNETVIGVFISSKSFSLNFPGNFIKK